MRGSGAAVRTLSAVACDWLLIRFQLSALWQAFRFEQLLVDFGIVLVYAVGAIDEHQLLAFFLSAFGEGLFTDAGIVALRELDGLQPSILLVRVFRNWQVAEISKKRLVLSAYCGR